MSHGRCAHAGVFVGLNLSTHDCGWFNVEQSLHSLTIKAVLCRVLLERVWTEASALENFSKVSCAGVFRQRGRIRQSVGARVDGTLSYDLIGASGRFLGIDDRCCGNGRS